MKSPSKSIFTNKSIYLFSFYLFRISYCICNMLYCYRLDCYTYYMIIIYQLLGRRGAHELYNLYCISFLGWSSTRIYWKGWLPGRDMAETDWKTIYISLSQGTFLVHIFPFILNFQSVKFISLIVQMTVPN